jgi:transposase
MKAYSQDLRERIVKAVEEGKSRREVAHVFHVSLSTVKRYLKQISEKGHLDPKPIPGRPKNKEAALRARLQAQLQASPDATLAESCFALS